MTATSATGLEKKQNSWDVGRDPRRMSREELVAAGHKPMSPLKALRLRCIDCCCHQPNEVRLCTAVACPNWPFRMGSNPWRSPSEGRRESGRRLARKRSSSDGNHKSDLSASTTPDVTATILPPEQSSTGETAVLSDTAGRTAVGGDAVR